MSVLLPGCNFLLKDFDIYDHIDFADASLHEYFMMLIMYVHITSYIFYIYSIDFDLLTLTHFRVAIFFSKRIIE